jgi:MraZ protein
MGEVRVVFLGTYVHTLDSKNRVTIPARLRRGLESGVILTRGFDPCLMIYTPDAWEEQTRRLSELPTTLEDRRLFTRLIYGGACEAMPDQMGRILVPQDLREFAGLVGDVVIVGANQAIELWSAERYRANLEGDIANLPGVLDRLSQKGL